MFGLEDPPRPPRPASHVRAPSFPRLPAKTMRFLIDVEIRYRIIFASSLDFYLNVDKKSHCFCVRAPSFPRFPAADRLAGDARGARRAASRRELASGLLSEIGAQSCTLSGGNACADVASRSLSLSLSPLSLSLSLSYPICTCARAHMHITQYISASLYRLVLTSFRAGLGVSLWTICCRVVAGGF